MNDRTQSFKGRQVTTKRSPVRFFALLYLMSAPFWAAGILFKGSGLPDSLPITDVGAVFMPTAAACILIYKEEGAGGVRKLLGRAFDIRRIGRRAWYLPVLFLMPAIYLLTAGVMGVIGIDLPGEWEISILTVPTFLFFLVGAAAEELGYTGYATDPLQERWGALTTALLIGTLWALWHVPSMIALGQSGALMAFGLAATMAWRVIYVWIYNNAGKSVFAVILTHAIGNTGRTAFPGGRAGFELSGGAVGYGTIVLTAAVIAALCDPRTLTRLRATDLKLS